MNQHPVKEWSITVSTPLPNTTVEPSFAACGGYNSLGEQNVSIYYQLLDSPTATPPWSLTGAAVDTRASLWQVELSNVPTSTQLVRFGIFEGIVADDANLKKSVTVPVTVASANDPGTVKIVPPVVPPFPPRHENVNLSGSYVPPAANWRDNYTLECVLFGKNDGGIGKILYCNFWHTGGDAYGGNVADGLKLEVDRESGQWTVNFGSRTDFQVLVVRMRLGRGYNMDYAHSTDAIGHTASAIIAGEAQAKCRAASLHYSP